MLFGIWQYWSHLRALPTISSFCFDQFYLGVRIIVVCLLTYGGVPRNVENCFMDSSTEKKSWGTLPSYLSSKLLDITSHVTTLMTRSIICSFIVYTKSNLLALLIIYVTLLCRQFIFVLINKSFLENRYEICEISGFCQEVAENCLLFGYYAASSGSYHHSRHSNTEERSSQI